MKSSERQLRLSVPARPPLPSTSAIHRQYPNPYTPSSAKPWPFPFSPSTTTPTPSKRPRANQGLPWLYAFLHLFALYSLSTSLQSGLHPLSLAPFTFLVLLISAAASAVLYRQAQRNRPPTSTQRALLLANGAFLALALVLRFQGLRSCGPMETILAEFAGGLAGRAWLSAGKSSDRGRKIRGTVALIAGVFLLSQGWDRAACFPLGGYLARSAGFKLAQDFNKPASCLRLFPLISPLAAGLMGALEKSCANRSSLRQIGKKRVRVISLGIAAAIVFPFAIYGIALADGESNSALLGSSIVWPLISTVCFGVLFSFHGETYCEERLMPTFSPKMFLITMCCTCVLELVYGLELSLLGFLFCGFLLWIAVKELGSPMPYSILECDSSDAFASLVKNPLHHVWSERKSRKIAIFLLINTAFMAVEFVSGFMSNSLGLISDACHMLFDCAALAIGLYASYISRLDANSKFNYGYGRFEVLSGYVNAVFLVLVGSLIVLESLERILDPQEISTESLLLVSVGGLLVNIVGLIFFHEEHHHAHAHSGGSCSHSHSHAHSHSHSHSHSDESHGHSLHLHDSHGGGSHNHSHTCTVRTVPCSSDEGALVTCEKNGSNPIDHFHHKHDHSGSGHDHVHRGHGQIDLGEGQHGKSHDHSCTDHNRGDASGELDLDKAQHGICGNHGHTVGQIDVDEGHHERSHDHSCNSSNESYRVGQTEHKQCTAILPSDKSCNDSHSCAHDHLILGEHEHHGHGHSERENCSVQTKQVGMVWLNHHDHDSGQQHQHFNQSHLYDHSHLGLSHSHSELSHSFSKHRASPSLEMSHDKSKDHHHIDHNMEGIFLHVLADTLGSVGVVASTLLIKYKGWLIADPACSIFISVLIISSVIPLLKNAAEILLQRVPRAAERDMKHALEDIHKVQGVHDFQNMHVWSLTNNEVVGTLHLHISPESDKTSIRGQVAHLLHDAGIKDLTLQMEYAGDR